MTKQTEEELNNFVLEQINELVNLSDDNLFAISHNLVSVSNEDISRKEKDEKVKEQLVHLFREILLASNTLNVNMLTKVLES